MAVVGAATSPVRFFDGAGICLGSGSCEGEELCLERGGAVSSEVRGVISVEMALLRDFGSAAR